MYFVKNILHINDIECLIKLIYLKCLILSNKITPKYFLREKEMKNITFYDSPKYKSERYEKVEDFIYKSHDKFLNVPMFVTSLSFEQEKELDEGDSPKMISQYPLEDVLEKFCVAVEDFYDEINEKSEKKCYLEFCATTVENIRALLTIVGKHIYNKEVVHEGKSFIKLIIE